MDKKKNIILAFGNKDFNNSLVELHRHFKFNIETIDNLNDTKTLDSYNGLIIHEDALKNPLTKKILQNSSINKVLFHVTKNIYNFEKLDKLELPVTFDQINKVVLNNLIKSEFKSNSSLKINEYILDKNMRKLIKKDLFLELTEKEIELIELLKKNHFTKKKEILSVIWKYSKEADTHTVETHIYRLRKKIKEVFNDEGFIKSEKRGYTI